MGKLGQIWQTVKDYWQSYLFIPCLFAVVSFIVRLKVKDRETAMSEIISWLVWVLIPALIGFIMVFLWHYFRDPYVEVKAEVIQVRTYDYYAGATGENVNEGDKELCINITLLPSKPVKVTDISLRVAGKLFPAKELEPTGSMIPFPPGDIKNIANYMLFFDIPKVFSINSNNVRVIATANKIKRLSKQLFINYR